LGEVITWSASGVKVKHRDLVHALREAGLDEAVARELAPRHAFTRACKKLSEDRIIRQVAEDDTFLRFQFTAEKRESDRFTYELETVLTLDKATGTVTCDLPGLATLAQELLDDAIEARTGGDITKVVQRLFERQADLFPIRDKGGAYFCPQEHASFVDRVQTFLGKLNGKLNRFPVPAGTPHGDSSVKDAVANGIAALIQEHRAAVTAFGSETRPSTLERAAERIRLVRHKVACYSAYLAEERERLERDLAEAARELRDKVEQLAAEREAEATRTAGATPSPVSEAPPPSSAAKSVGPVDRPTTALPHS
jgi:hypothetical protein